MNWKNTVRRLEPEIEQLTLVVKECDKMMLQCISWISETFLKSVKPSDVYGKATQILLKNPFYSRFFQIYLYLQQELTISLDSQRFLTELTMQKVSDLYEVWSVFEITRIIVDELKTSGYIVASNTIFYEVDRNFFQVKIRKNAASIVMKKHDIRVELRYEPIYLSKNNPSVSAISSLIANLNDPHDQRTPDLAIEVYQEDQPISVLIFDVKYKWQGAVGSRKPTKHGRDDMREYRDIICYKPQSPGYPTRIRKIVSNAYILYPGDEIWEEHPNKVGALPFVPDMASAKKVEVRKKIKNLLHAARLL